MLIFQKHFSLIIRLFSKYFFWALKIGLNFLLFIFVDLPLAVLIVARWTHYLIFFYQLYDGLLGQLGYWLARYLTVEDWIYDGYNAPEFENHYYQWRFFLVVRRYLLFAVGIIIKIIIGWILSILHFFYWFAFQVISNRKRLLKKAYYNCEFIYWRIIYAIGVRLNLSINNSSRLLAYSKDFFCFDRKGWYYYGRDFIDMESRRLAELYIPKKFRIKKDDDQVSEEKKQSFRRFLYNMKRQSLLQFGQEDLQKFVKYFDKDISEGLAYKSYDFYENLLVVVEREYWEQQEQLLKKNKLYSDEGRLKQLTDKERQELLINIANAKKSKSKKLVLTLRDNYQEDVKDKVLENNENAYKILKTSPEQKAL